MSKKTTYIVFIILVIIIGSFLNWKYCCSATEDTTEKVIVTPVQKNTQNGLTIVDQDGSFNFESVDHLNFAKSSSKIIQPVSENINNGVSKLKVYLEGHPEKTILLTGLYNSTETYDGAFPDLGIARATAVKNYLTSKGISSTQIDLFSQEKNDLTIENDIYIGPLSLSIHDTQVTEKEELTQLKERIISDPLVVHFQTGQSSPTLSTIQKQKIADIARYIDKTIESSVLITGHTDNVGSTANNIALGQQRASYMRKFLIDNGIPSNKITTDSKGPQEPIAPNNTSEGRAKNRRTIVTIH